MQDPNEDDELFSQFNDIDPAKIALETAAASLAGMFKAFRAQGLTEREAAVLVITLMKESEHGYTEGDSKSEHEA